MHSGRDGRRQESALPSGFVVDLEDKSDISSSYFGAFVPTTKPVERTQAIKLTSAEREIALFLIRGEQRARNLPQRA